MAKKKGSKPLMHDLETVLDAINGEGFWAAEPGEQRLTSSFGNVTTIARRLGVGRQTVYNYLDRWTTARAALEDAREQRKDLVEDRMLRRILEGSDTMMIFFAKTQMKDRGYVERTELVGVDDQPFTLRVVYDADVVH